MNIEPMDKTCLDTNFSISFISENNNEAIFYAEDASEFIDYLNEINPQIIQNILSEDFEPTHELIELLQESILSYIEENSIPCGCDDYYSQLFDFLENSAINGITISIEEGDDDEDEDINEAIYENLQVIPWDIEVKKDVQSLLQEAKYKKVVRGGRLINRQVCPPGYRLSGGQCIRMATSEVRKRMKAALKAAKTRKKEFRNSMFKQMLLKKRARSMNVRRSRGL